MTDESFNIVIAGGGSAWASVISIFPFSCGGIDARSELAALGPARSHQPYGVGDRVTTRVGNYLTGRRIKRVPELQSESLVPASCPTPAA